MYDASNGCKIAIQTTFPYEVFTFDAVFEYAEVI